MMLYNRLICYLLLSVLFVLFGCSSPNREIQPFQGNQSEQRAIRPVAQTTSSDYRQALVIGNSDYDYAGILRNPINDAQAISNTLGELGFKVRTVIDADKRGMEQAIRSFGKQLRDRKGVGLFYYAGHGMQLDGENYLLPVNINPDTEDDVLYDGVPLGKLLAQMKSAGNGMNVVILDACRNNPFARSFRSTSRGLAQVVAPTGSFISYATAPGQIAADGSGENGLYTSKLLKHMATPGVKLEDVFKRVRVDVQQESNGRQVPWDASSVTGDFYFVTGIAAAPDPNQINLADLQKRANVEQSNRLEQQRKRDNWDNWQQKMQNDYERVLAFEKRSVGAALKVESWQLFLENWADDNPYSTQDTDFRSGAQAKVSYWRKELRAEKPTETFTFPDGRKYVGEFLDGQFHGWGTFTFPDGRKYVGEFRNGVKHGQGTFTFSSRTGPMAQFAGQKYVGELRNDSFNGQGIYTFPDGAKYVGEFKNDKRHGQGTFTFPDGSVKSGLWKDNKFIE